MDSFLGAYGLWNKFVCRLFGIEFVCTCSVRSSRKVGEWRTDRVLGSRHKDLGSVATVIRPLQDGSLAWLCNTLMEKIHNKGVQESLR